MQNKDNKKHAGDASPKLFFLFLFMDRLAAILDFVYNLGSGRLKTSTLRRKINARQWADVPVELMKWNKAGGKVLRGLTLRRQVEANLISTLWGFLCSNQP